MNNDLMEKVVSLCKRRGFIFQSSDIYGGLANTWDYGPYGVELKNNVKQAWWKAVVYERDDILGMDAAILMHPKVWEASGHIKNFFDLKSDCKACKKWYKASDLKDKKTCPECKGQLSEARPFNLMFETYQGPVKDTASLIYLRPETAQGMFVNFSNILDSRHPKLPFGMAQIGKAFRNEITPGNFTFRTREFEQMEIEYFVNPKDADKFYEYWVDERFNWYLKLGIKKENLRKHPHTKDELAHYAKACTDIEYNFPFGTSTSSLDFARDDPERVKRVEGPLSADGERPSTSLGTSPEFIEGRSRTIGWSELEGIANRTDFDLKQHSAASGKDLKYFDDANKEKFYPYIIEPSGGIDRSVLAFLADAYYEEKVKDDIRVVLKLHKSLAPTKVAVLPLLKNRPQIVELAKKIAQGLKKIFITVYDDTAAIGKLYRRQDEVGTLYCVTVDVQSLEDKQVTVRDRDTMLQDRVSIDKVKEYLLDRLSN